MTDRRHWRQQLRQAARALYRTDRLLPYRLKRRLRKRFVDPLIWRWQSHYNTPPLAPGDQAVATDLQAQIDANLSLSEQARRELQWFLQDPRATIEIGHHGEGSSDGPLVSLVLILFNKAELTYACLRSIEQLYHRNLELIIVDNASTDQTEELLKKLKGNIRVLRQKENLHFLRGCNLAFSHLATESNYVLLVNNDALIDPLAIHQAIEVFNRWPNTGIVGGQVLHLDGRLQEAGNVIFRDGVCSGLGRRQSPWHPLAQTRRKVDYVSGCLFMLETALLQELGGFDTRFEPAYYEETDLCIRSWQAGRPVIYEPTCQVRHVEFASSNQGQGDATALMQINRAKLENKHQAWLQHQPTTDTHQDLESINTCMRLQAYPARVLWIDDRNPDPRFGAGYGRMHDLIAILAEIGCFITIFATHQQPDPRLHAASSDYELHWGGLHELGELLQTRKDFYTHICASRQHNLRLLKNWLRLQDGSEAGRRPLLIADIESLFSIREHAQNYLQKTGVIATIELDELTKTSELQQELTDLQPIDRFLTVSEREAALLRSVLKKPVEVAGHAFVVPESSALGTFTACKGMLFMGAMTHPDLPNIDSLRWLAEAILPGLKNQGRLDPQQCPLTIVGPSKADLIQPLLEQIILHWPVDYLGHLEDVDPILRQHRVFLAPTRFAAGLPHKVQHAVSQGTPVVTTALIANQMDWRSGDGLLYSNDPEEFATHITNLHCNAALWQSTREQGMARIRIECQRNKVKNALEKTFLVSHL